ncbi:hypothetical protein IDH44_03750 [Paenibacillus sp. IB182496]|uniref:Uncharacterized protein n=1 Tax=Paenibacillus sabuli TaxID=2772509 RepID=A0A927GR00_9BACL|nr:hypothetical protein [Paenibacillus sabuli]MBD2844292.1 hypothetical protein [Paenibacillus sabuli]
MPSQSTPYKRRRMHAHACVRLGLALLLTAAIAAGGAAERAHAGLFDRMKDIYTAPDKLDEVREEYDSLTETLQEQNEKLQQTQQNALDAAARFEEQQRAYEEQQRQWETASQSYQDQNALLAERNRELTARLELLEQERQERNALLRKALTVGAAIIGVILLYFIAMRVLRITIWRRERRI